MAAIFKPLALRDLTIPNRIVVSPMCQYSAVEGNAQTWHSVHLGQLAMGSPGLLILEATAVEAIGRITPGCLGLYSDENETSMAELLSDLRALSPARRVPVCIQLSHAGRKASSNIPWETGKQIPLDEGGWEAVAPSDIAHGAGELAPSELSVEDMQELIARFITAVERSLRLEIDAIELHCAHGYLVHQFLSPVANHRTDKYGGSLQNRMRFPLELFSAMRAAWPENKPLGVRISACDWDSTSSWNIDESIVFSQSLAESGCDWIDVSSGGVSSKQKIELKPGYQLHFAEAISRAVDIPVMAVGLITEAEQAENIVASGQADMVALARALLYNPRWIWHAAATLGATVDVPEQYWRCAPSGLGRVFGDTPIGQR